MEKKFSLAELFLWADQFLTVCVIDYTVASESISTPSVFHLIVL